jgi:hypothetical protein
MKNLLFLILLLCNIGCGQTSQDYFPLGGDFRWEYIIEEKLNDKHKIFKSLVANLDSKTIDSIEYFPRRSVNGETYYFSKTKQGILLSSAANQNGEIILGFPLEVGTQWQAVTRIKILDSRHESFSGGESFISLDDQIILDLQITKLDDTVTVPAGTFTNCLRIESYASVTVKERTRGIERILIQQTEWYGIGVGLVKRIRNERSVPDKYKGEQVQKLVLLQH